MYDICCHLDKHTNEGEVAKFPEMTLCNFIQLMLCLALPQTVAESDTSDYIVLGLRYNRRTRRLLVCVVTSTRCIRIKQMIRQIVAAREINII